MNNTAKRETEILTVDNVQFIGERIATCAVRGYARLSGNDKDEAQSFLTLTNIKNASARCRTDAADKLLPIWLIR